MDPDSAIRIAVFFDHMDVLCLLRCAGIRSKWLRTLEPHQQQSNALFGLAHAEQRVCVTINGLLCAHPGQSAATRHSRAPRLVHLTWTNSHADCQARLCRTRRLPRGTCGRWSRLFNLNNYDAAQLLSRFLTLRLKLALSRMSL